MIISLLFKSALGREIITLLLYRLFFTIAYKIAMTKNLNEADKFGDFLREEEEQCISEKCTSLFERD